MAETHILGVDFSGAEKTNTTAVTRGILRNDVLELEWCNQLSKKREDALYELKGQLLDLKKNAVAAMDFPFSVPWDFAHWLDPRAVMMPEVWDAAKNKGYSAFEKLARFFVRRHGEMMRWGDTNFGGPVSPLHEFNPSMLKMTYYGMCLLHKLRNEGFRVPPLEDDGCEGPILLETMPGVLLRNFGLPARNYKTKNQSNKKCPEDTREKILSRLESLSGVKIKIPDDIREKCVDNHDCLDSLVAAIGAALWVQDKSKFLTPCESIDANEEIQAAKLEGWIYAPRPIS